MADDEIRKRAFIIIEDANLARHDSFNGCVELVKSEHAKDPTRKFIVAQVLATIEPAVSSKITRHF